MVRRFDMAWAAGLFEGEGTAYVKVTKSRREGHPGYRHPVLQVTMTDEDVLRTFTDVVGVGKMYGPYANGQHKPRYLWQTNGDVALTLARRLLPFMHARRAGKLGELLKEFA